MNDYEKSLGEKIMEAIIITIVVTGTVFMMYGFYEVLDLVYFRGRLSC